MINLKINSEAYNFPQYMSLMLSRMEISNNVNGDAFNRTDEYIKLNYHRMLRLSKSITLSDDIFENLSRIRIRQTWILIAEDWCGDCAQNIPVIAKMAEHPYGLINLMIIFRDKNPEWIKTYHTDGKHSVPKLISFSDSGKELFRWGPRPGPAQDLLKKWKAYPGNRSHDDFELELHSWYAKDKANTIQSEFVELFKKIHSNYEPPFISDFYLN